MDQLDLSALKWAQESVGEKLLAYLLGCNSEALPGLIAGNSDLTETQREVVGDLSFVRDSIRDLPDGLPIGNPLQNYLMHITDTGQYIAASMHEHVAGPTQVATGRDAMERALARLAADIYPAFLLPPDPALPPMAHYFGGPPIGRLLFKHPQQKEFVEAVQQDPTLKKIAAHTADDDNLEASAQEHARSPAELHVLTITDLLLNSAWRKLPEEDFTPENFVTATLDGLQLLRDAFAGKVRTVSAKVAFTGVLLPPGRRLELDVGSMRAVTEAERRFVPDDIKGQLTSGSTRLNYDGDVVLELKVPYRVRMQEDEAGSPSMEIPLPSRLKQTITRLRFSLVLAIEREYRVLLVETWRGYDDPLQYGFVSQWRDRRHGGINLTPTQLTETELQAWREWYHRLNPSRVAKIELALNRVLLAMAERTEPADVLIDSVIAWENLFSGKYGVTKCLAALFEANGKARQERKVRLGRVYGLRSKIVHGGAALKDSEQPLCDEALDAAIRAVRILVSDRIDILELGSGDERGKAILLDSPLQ